MFNYKKILFVGDIHQNIKHSKFIVKKAIELKADCIVQVGDFGYWPHTTYGSTFLTQTSDILVKNNINLFFIDGNHENFLALWADSKLNSSGQSQKYEYTDEGFKIMAPNLFYIPRGTRWEWNKIKFLGMGGAFSVDKQYRIGHETLNNKPYTLWWPDEDIRNTDFELAMNGEAFDILVSHDMPLNHSIPDFFNYKDEYLENDSHHNNRQALQQIVDQFNPKCIFHGHYHHYYATVFDNNGHNIFVHGLNCDRKFNESYVFINLDELDKFSA